MLTEHTYVTYELGHMHKTKIRSCNIHKLHMDECSRNINKLHMDECSHNIHKLHTSTTYIQLTSKSK